MSVDKDDGKTAVPMPSNDIPAKPWSGKGYVGKDGLFQPQDPDKVAVGAAVGSPNSVGWKAVNYFRKGKMEVKIVKASEMTEEGVWV